MAAGAELIAFSSNVDTTKSNLGQVRNQLKTIFDFIDDAEDLVDYIDYTGIISNKVYELSEYAVSIIKLLEKMGPLGQTAKTIRVVLDGGPLDQDPNVLDFSDAIRRVVWDINGDIDKNGNGRIDPLSINPNGEEGMRLDNLEDKLNLAKAGVAAQILAVDARIAYLDGVSQTTSGFITALDVATQSGAAWESDFTGLRDNLETFVTPANVAMASVNSAYATVVNSLGDLLDIFNLADIDLSIDVNLDFGSLEDVLNVLEEPLRIAASAIEPIEPYLDAVGAAIDLIVTPVVKFLTETLELNQFLDAITDQIEQFLPDFSPLENFEAQVNALIAELTNFTAATMGEIDSLLTNVETAVEKVGNAASTVPVWGDIALGPVGIGNALNEILIGGNDAEIFDPKGGNDTVNAGGGNDIIMASTGNDTINGGAGVDMLYINAGFGEFELFREVDGGPIKILHVRPDQNAVDYGTETINTDVEILAFNNVVFDNIQDAIIGGSVLNGDINADKDDLLILNTTGTLVNGYHQANGLTGDDSIYGTAEADHLIGGTGNDLLVGQDGADLLDGGDGSDTFLQLEGRNEDIKIDLGDGVGTSDASFSAFASDEDDDTLLNIENYISEGTGSGDQRFVFGDSNDNTLKTGAASDIIVGGAGDDIIDGGDATDMLIGGDGSDRIFGGKGSDFIIGGGAAAVGDSDVYDGGEDYNTLTFESDPDDPPNQLSSPTVAPNIIAQAFGTIATNSAVRIDANTGIIEHLDSIGGVIATDTSANFNKYIGSDFDDTIYGFLKRNDIGQVGIEGAGGDDALYVRNSQFANGGAGDDTFFLTTDGGGANINGQGGIDTVDITGMGDVRVTLAETSPNSGDLSLRLYRATDQTEFSDNFSLSNYSSERLFTARVEGIENFTFGEFDDFVDFDISLNSASYTIDTAGGNDLVLHDKGYIDLATGAGSDRIIADAAANVSAGADDDYIEFYRDGDASFTRSVDGGSGNDTIVLRNFGLTTVAAPVVGGTGFDTLAFWDFQNGASISVDLTAGTVFDQGGSGSTNQVNATVASVERVIGSVGSDTLLGSALGDQFIGREGSDMIDGRAGNDIIYGGDAIDTLTGGDGNDLIHGGLGNDVIDGGTNSDPNAVEADTVSYATGYRDTLVGDLVANAFGGVTVDLEAGTSSGAFGNDNLTNIENVHGSNNDDTLLGDSAANYLAGGLGDDFMDGRDGDDFFSLEGDDWAEGSGGDDIFFVAGGGTFSVHGGAGHDVLDFSAQDGALTIDLSESQISGTMDVLVPVWSDFGTDEARTVDGVTLTPIEILEADPLYSNDAADASRIVPDEEAFEIELVAQSQAFQSLVTGIDEVIGTSGADTITGRDGFGASGGGSIDTLSLNPDSETGQYAEIANFSAMPTGSLTLEMLYRSDRPLDPAGPDLIFASYAIGNTAGGNSILIFGLPDSTIGIRFNNTEFYQTPVSTTVLTDGSPHRLSVVYDTAADEIGLFVDGTQVFSGTSQTLNGIPSNGKLIFGQEQDNANTTSDFNPNQILPGEIADIRIWDDVRTAQEISDHAFAELAAPASEQGLVANWRPDAASATIIADAANPGGGNDLALQSYGGSSLPTFSIFESGGGDTLNGGDGSDTYHVFDHGDTVIEVAGEGYDRVNTDLSTYTLPENVERLAFTDADDHVGQGNGLANVLVGNSGRDSLAGRGDNDTLHGGAENDTLYGQNGEDILNGNTGNDRLLGGADNDILNGGAGFDTASYSGASGGVSVYLSYTGIDVGSGEGIDTLLSIENLTGSNFDDRLIGDASNNVLTGGDGNDILKGKGGDDTFNGGDGDDRMTGGSGIDIMNGGAGSDIIFALAGDDILNGGDDRDFVYGGRDTDTVHGDGGDDEVRGNLGNDMIFGDAGSDDLRGGGNNDMLDGGIDNDFLFGENGQDTLIGGAGSDSLSGGLGGGVGDGFQDTFVYSDTASGGGGFDRIKDFENGTDLIDLTSFSYTNFLQVNATSANSGADTRINFGSGDVLYIENFAIGDLDASDVLI